MQIVAMCDIASRYCTTFSAAMNIISGTKVGQGCINGLTVVIKFNECCIFSPSASCEVSTCLSRVMNGACEFVSVCVCVCVCVCVHVCVCVCVCVCVLCE